MANETNTMLIDFTGVESGNFIGEGEHLVRIKEAAFTKASTGSSQLEVNFEDSNGATRKAWYNLLPQALWKVKGFLESIGIPCEGKVNLSTRVLIGKACRIVVEPDPNDSKKFVVADVKSAAEPTMVEAPYAAPQPAQAPVQQATPQPAPTQQVTAAPSNLPPWMNSIPTSSNLPPWMNKNQ